ncbi:transferase family hexapeptide repeat protein [Actinocorallia herbida]|uniref:Transferase family hexapeptide repeat protein n=1 Tax=Actinocorallia herbida TaxID=58109 RepID=A0A3N1DB43_9ACTN|nr:acyltransferase [Actinocorallia herbida]ROO90686.1 transferase family hexapeptide repeat protein [Actinocorallia herbida]
MLKDGVRKLAAAAVHRAYALVRRLGEITPATPGGKRFHHLGEGVCIAFPQGAIFGDPWISIGAHTLIGTHVSISAGFVPDLDLGPDVIVKIGSACSIGRGSHIVGHQSIEIGKDVFTGPYVYITDQNHTYAELDAPIGRQWPENAPVEIGDGCWLGTQAVILPGTRLGKNVAVAAGAVVRGEFPDNCVIGGIPAKILRRHDPDEGWIPPMKDRPVPTAEELALLALSMEGMQELQDRMRKDPA